MFSLEDLVGLHRSVQLQFLQHYCLGHTWITVILNCLLGIKEIILSFLRLHLSTAFQTLVDYDGYSISSKGFLPTIVDIIVI